jgi:WXG100 family type VII secretion target
MDLRLDREAFAQASREMAGHGQDLSALRRDIVSSFAQLRQDWDSEAGRAFFAKRLENDLLKHLDDHVLVFEHMSRNLTTASQQYEEVFSVADAVANARY